MTPLGWIVAAAGYVGAFATLLGYIHTAGRKINAIAEGQRCLLRGEITEIYYKHADDPAPTLREYERQNLDKAYAGYVALNGNSYIKDIYQLMRAWRVVT